MTVHDLLNDARRALDAVESEAAAVLESAAATPPAGTSSITEDVIKDILSVVEGNIAGLPATILAQVEDAIRAKVVPAPAPPAPPAA
ncbi:MAG TPA: hypothetical protein VNV87_04460 [Acidimicrobiales bacterium]|jgi:hypothetical protein|nr:hypothetical protein [Acidimicrobiales bacterium]